MSADLRDATRRDRGHRCEVRVPYATCAHRRQRLGLDQRYEVGQVETLTCTGDTSTGILMKLIRNILNRAFTKSLIHEANRPELRNIVLAVVWANDLCEIFELAEKMSRQCEVGTRS